MTELDQTGCRVVQAKEHEGVRLRNSALVGLPTGKGAVDVVVERATQEEWLNGVDVQADVSARCTQTIGRGRTAQNFRTLSERPYYDLLLDILAAYVRQVMPASDRTEQSFWCVIAMPGTGCTTTWQWGAAITVDNVKTLVLGASTEDDGVDYLAGFLNVTADFRLPSTLDVETAEY